VLRTILVVDDDPLVRDSLTERLKLEGYRAIAAADGEQAARIVREERPHIAIVDVNLPGMSGLELLDRIKRDSPGTSVIVLTGYGSVEDAVEAMKKGAENYLLKPCSMDELKIILKNISGQQALRDENLALKRELEKRYGLGAIIGRSAAMRPVFERLEAVARSETNALILGETGTGKDLVARAIHARSTRRSGPFVKVDCASLPETLLESELFGHEKGAFTGAARAQAGRFEQAEGGSLFLDEIGNLSPATQAKLLNVIQDREFTPLGGDRKVSADIRLICATNIDLDRAVAAGNFREDLYYRINVVPIRVPPLRERREDIPLLATAFLERFRKDNNRGMIRMTQEAMDLICAHDWPGNVRELENTIERSVILLRNDEITPADLPSRISKPDRPGAPASALPENTILKKMVEAFEANVIRAALEECGGSRERTASRLGITRITLYNKMKRCGLMED
jgi:DNA-binding NtrC family response regulator